jgi:hypothetical protein
LLGVTRGVKGKDNDLISLKERESRGRMGIVMRWKGRRSYAQETRGGKAAVVADQPLLDLHHGGELVAGIILCSPLPNYIFEQEDMHLGACKVKALGSGVNMAPA